MKQLLLIFTLAVFSTGLLGAQPITLTHENYGAVKPGSSMVWNIMATTNIDAPQSGENRVWDYSSAQTISFFATDYNTPANSSFPTATVVSPIMYSLAGFVIEGRSYDEVNQEGHFHLGNHFDAASVELDLGFGTGKLDVPAQDAELYRKEMIFPATYGSQWNTPDTRYVVNANLTALLYQNTPSELVQHYTVNDEIIGWGTILLPGQKSFEVLLKKQTVVQIDSFYIGGQPAPALILDQLGVNQGDETRTELYTFHAAGIEGEVMSYSRTTTQGSTDRFAYYNANLPTSVAEEQSKSFSRLYPNPVTTGGAVVEFDKTSDAPWSVKVTDALGNAVQTISVTSPAGRAHIQLPLDMSLANGAYFYTIQNDHGVRTGGGTVFLSR
jgi:hypothetical protein